MSLDEGVRSTYEGNKRELFDAMRAYHDSELAHKRDAIGMLTTLLTAIGAVFAVFIVPSHPIAHAGALAWSIALVAVALAAVIVSSTNRKIAEDHKLYARFGDEYVRQCDALGLFDTVEMGGGRKPIKKRARIGHGQGYRHTQRIVRSVGIAIGTLAIFGAIVVQMAEPRAPAPERPPAPRGGSTELRATPDTARGDLR